MITGPVPDIFFFTIGWSSSTVLRIIMQACGEFKISFLAQEIPFINTILNK